MAGDEPNKRTFKEGERLFSEGDRGSVAYVIESGRVEISKRGPSGEERVLALVGRGEVIGEMALIDDQPRIATVRAVQETVCVVISSEAFKRKLTKVDPAIRRLLEKFVGLARDYANEKAYGVPLRRPVPDEEELPGNERK